VTEPVALESIPSCFRGVIPSPFATCSPDGVPNVTYMSIVQYVDSDRVALSRQFFNKTRANLDANPASQVWVVDPETLEQYELDLEYLHTESDGPVFEAMRADVDAIASQTGATEIFRLRGVDIRRVLRCARAHHAHRNRWTRTHVTSRAYVCTGDTKFTFRLPARHWERRTSARPGRLKPSGPLAYSVLELHSCGS
jgi:hypothetical protein